jgi:hypothetical protein
MSEVSAKFRQAVRFRERNQAGPRTDPNMPLIIFPPA